MSRDFLRKLDFRPSLATIRRRRKFSRALAQFRARPWDVLNRGNTLLEDLIDGWGNPAWSAQVEFIQIMLREVARGRGPILECGSGLTTILLGITADVTGRKIISLEHSDEWRNRVQGVLDQHGLADVRMYCAPLKNYGAYTWYDPPLAELPEDFSLVVCDGPPGNTEGGRYGLVPTMAAHFSQGVTLLLDDGCRDSEQAVAARWASELNREFVSVGQERSVLISCPFQPNAPEQVEDDPIPLVSIGIPTYNNATYLRKSVQSALDQSDISLEVIVSDNASTDDTPSVCAEMAANDRRLYCYRQPENFGVFKNYNDVFLKSRAKYFKWQSASDTSDPTFVSRCLEALEESDDVVLACPKVRIVDEKGRVTNYSKDFGLGMDAPSERFAFLVENLALSNMYNGVVRSDSLSQTGLNRQYRGSDIPLLAELALQGKFALISTRLWDRNMTAETASAKKTAEQSEAFFAGSSSRNRSRETWKKYFWLVVAVLRSDISAGEKWSCFRFLLKDIRWARRTLFRELFEI